MEIRANLVRGSLRSVFRVCFDDKGTYEVSVFRSGSFGNVSRANTIRDRQSTVDDHCTVL